MPSNTDKLTLKSLVKPLRTIEGFDNLKITHSRTYGTPTLVLTLTQEGCEYKYRFSEGTILKNTYVQRCFKIEFKAGSFPDYEETHRVTIPSSIPCLIRTHCLDFIEFEKEWENNPQGRAKLLHQWEIKYPPVVN